MIDDALIDASRESSSRFEKAHGRESYPSHMIKKESHQYVRLKTPKVVYFRLRPLSFSRSPDTSLL
jgi:hypothetical protein